MTTAADDEQILIFPELAEGQELHFLPQHTNLSESSLESSSSPGQTALTCTVVQAFRPFTMSPVLLVSLAQPAASAPSESLPSLPSQAILKLFDRRCLSNLREQHDDNKPWSLDKEREHRKYLAAVAAGTIEPSEDFDDPLYLWDEDRSDGEIEAYLQRQAQKDFDMERTAYERLRALQGTKIPRLYGTVEYEVNISLPDSDSDSDSRSDGSGSEPESSVVTSTRTEIVPGLLLQYIPSVTLRQLVMGWTVREPPLPAAALAALCEEVVRVVDRVSDFDVLNGDVRMDNFLVREPFVAVTPALQEVVSRGDAPPLASSDGRSSKPAERVGSGGGGGGGDPGPTVAVIEDPVVLIDLAQCRLREPGESEKECTGPRQCKTRRERLGPCCVVFLLREKDVVQTTLSTKFKLLLKWPSRTLYRLLPRADETVR
ncbi:hypothetical protein V8D89_002849 [Ganoderma adspersum]